MNVLEKILKEIEEMRDIMKSTVATNCFGKECKNEDCTVCVCERAMEIIHSHMDDIPDANISNKRLIDANALDKEVRNFFLAITGNPKQATVVRECKKSFRRIIDEQQTVYANDDWIPCSEYLPEVPEGIEDDYCPEFNVTIKGADKATTLKYAPDGTWFDDSGEVYNVIAWQPLPEPYKGE